MCTYLVHTVVRPIEVSKIASNDSKWHDIFFAKIIFGSVQSLMVVCADLAGKTELISGLTRHLGMRAIYGMRISLDYSRAPPCISPLTHKRKDNVIV